MKEYKIEEPMPQYGEDVARVVYVPEEVVKQIRADAIDEFAERLALYLGVEGATKYGNENAEQMNISYNTTLNYEIADAIDDVREQLKEQNK